VNGDFRIGPWLVEPTLNRISQNGASRHLEPKVMQVLLCLAKARGEVVSKQQLIEGVWKETFVTDDVLTRSISELRDAFGDEARESRIVQTIPKQGYRLLLPVTQSSAAVTPGRQKWDRRKFALWLALTVVLVAVVSWILVWRFPSSTSTEPQIRSIAVLPLANLSGDPQQEYLADGMTEALITELSRVKALKVISRTSIMRYKGERKPLREIARELGVEGIVEGSVLRVGEQVRITAELINAHSDTHLWAESYERDLRDLLNVQKTIARVIVQQVRANLTAHELQRLTQSPVRISTGAYELYLRARDLWNRRTKRADLQQVIELLNRTLEKEPGYAPAYAALSEAYAVASQYRVLPAPEAFARARIAAAKALELDDTLAEAHAAMGAVKNDWDWDWEGAERHYRRAIELSPNYASVRHWYSRFLSQQARHEEAIAQARSTEELDPLNYVYGLGLGDALLFGRRYNDAIAAFRKLAELHPREAEVFGRLAKCRELKGEYDQAIEARSQEWRLSGTAEKEISDLHRAYKEGGWKAAARFMLKEVDNKNGARMRAAALNTVLGNFDRALDVLQTELAERSIQTLFLQVDPRWDPLRSDPRFQNLVRRMNFPT
jgi:TolB-like protein/DNA-binding winged helix-turn-helix (wHTH) protein/Flp pilus assembly protein TadD